MNIPGIGGEGAKPARIISAEVAGIKQDLKEIGDSISEVTQQAINSYKEQYASTPEKGQKKALRKKWTKLEKQRKLIVKNLTRKKAADFTKLKEQVKAFRKMMPEESQTRAELKGHIKDISQKLEARDRRISDHLRQHISDLGQNLRPNASISRVFDQIFTGEKAALEKIESERYESRREGFKQILKEGEKLAKIEELVVSQTEALSSAAALKETVNSECNRIEKQLTKISDALVEKHKEHSAKSLEAGTAIMDKRASLKDKQDGVGLLEKLSFMGKDARQIRALKAELRKLENIEKKEEAKLELLNQEIINVSNRLKQDIERTEEEKGKIIAGRDKIQDALETGLENVSSEEMVYKADELREEVGSLVKTQKQALDELVQPTKVFMKDVTKRWKLKL